MKLAFQQAYPAPPQRVLELLRNDEFIDDVAQHAGAVSHEARVLGDRTELDMELPTPQHVASVVGKTVKLTLAMAFAEPRDDGSVPGTVDVTVPGMPVQAQMTGLLSPRGEETVGEYNGELKVKIPLVGKKVEAQIEPYVVSAFNGIERRAKVWLER